MNSNTKLTPSRSWKQFAMLAITALLAAPLYAEDDDPNQPPDPTVTITVTSGQSFPGADISPDICLNAQTEYKTLEFDISITPSDKKATLTTSGGVSLDKTAVSDGDVVTATGSSTGSYSITITHDEDSNVTDKVEGIVFEFKFAEMNSTDDAPKNHTDEGSYDESSFEATTRSGDNDVNEGAFLSKNYLLIVETIPAGAYTEDVEASAKLSVEWSAEGSITKSYIDGSGSPSISVGYGPVSAGFSTSGEEILAGLAVGLKVNSENEELTWEKEKWKYSSEGKNVPFGLPAKTFTDSQSGTENPTDIKRTYTVGSTQGFDLRVQMGISASTNHKKESGSLKGVDVNSSSMSGDDPPDVVEDDGKFVIL